MQWYESSTELGEFLKRHDNILLDCDGVLWAGGEAISGSVETVDALRKAGKKVLFITNNSSKSRREYSEKLNGFGIATSKSDVITSGSAMADYLFGHGIKSVYVIGEKGLIEELEGVGIKCVYDKNNASPFMDEADFLSFNADPSVEAVCVGWDRFFTFRKLTISSIYLQRGCRFIGANPDISDRVGELLFPGTGPILASIESASGVSPYIIGKPNPALVKQILERNKMEACNTVMIGDRMDTDIAFANSAGITSVLVMTGVTTEDDLDESHDFSDTPSLVMPSLSSILPGLKIESKI